MKKRVLSMILAAMLLVAMTASASAATFLSIATGGTTGTYYPLGGDIANLRKRLKTLQGGWRVQPLQVDMQGVIVK